MYGVSRATYLFGDHYRKKARLHDTLLGAPGLTTRSKDATVGLLHTGWIHGTSVDASAGAQPAAERGDADSQHDDVLGGDSGGGDRGETERPPETPRTEIAERGHGCLFRRRCRCLFDHTGVLVDTAENSECSPFFGKIRPQGGCRAIPFTGQ